MPEFLLLNGEIVPASAAQVSVLDRGFLFGDGIYEVVRVRNGRPQFFDRHLDRLRRGLEAVEIPEPVALRAGCESLLEADAIIDGSLYIQVTRGAGERTHLPPPDLMPKWLAIPSHQPPMVPGTRPLHAVSMPDPRWQRCDIKTISLMGTVLGKLSARHAECDEVVFVGPDGTVREGGSTSVFVRCGERVETHPLDGHVLASITRERVLALCGKLGLSAVETAPQLAQRGSWDEAFLCGTLTGLQALVALDGKPIGSGLIGAWTAMLAQALERESNEAAEGNLA